MRTKIFLFALVACLGLALTAFVQSEAFSSGESLQSLSLLEFQEATAAGCIGLADCCKKPTTGLACTCDGQVVIPQTCDQSGSGCSPIECP